MLNPNRRRRKWSRSRVFSTLHAGLISKEITFPAVSLLPLHTSSSGGLIPKTGPQTVVHRRGRCNIMIMSCALIGLWDESSFLTLFLRRLLPQDRLWADFFPANFQKKKVCFLLPAIGSALQNLSPGDPARWGPGGSWKQSRRSGERAVIQI